MAEHRFKVGPITWTVRNEPGTLAYSGGLMKGEVPKRTIVGWGVADLSGSFAAATTEDQDLMGGIGKLMGVGAMAQLLVAHAPRPGKKKLLYVNLDFSDPECPALIEALKHELGSTFVGIGPSGAIRAKLGISNTGPILIALTLMAALAAALWLVFR